MLAAARWQADILIPCAGEPCVRRVEVCGLRAGPGRAGFPHRGAENCEELLVRSFLNGFSKLGENTRSVFEN